MAVTPVPAGSVHGVPVTGSVPSAGAAKGVQPAPAGQWSTAPYKGRGSKCMGNDNTCGANRMKGQDYCAGHSRSVQKVIPFAPTALGGDE